MSLSRSKKHRARPSTGSGSVTLTCHDRVRVVRPEMSLKSEEGQDRGMSTRERFARQSPFSDPGRHGALLRELDGIEEISAMVSNLVLHYRAEADLLLEDRRDEINSRWISTILDLDQQRHPGPLLRPRPPADRVAGCCRDHALLAVAALREQGIPARSRVGFTGYFDPGCPKTGATEPDGSEDAIAAPSSSQDRKSVV